MQNEQETKRSEETTSTETTKRDGDVTTEKTTEVEKSTEETSTEGDGTESTTKTDVNINQTFNTPAATPAVDPNKNYEAAQPPVDGV